MVYSVNIAITGGLVAFDTQELRILKEGLFEATGGLVDAYACITHLVVLVPNSLQDKDLEKRIQELSSRLDKLLSLLDQINKL